MNLGGGQTKYKPEYCQGIIDHCSNNGATFGSYALKIGVVPDTLVDWARAHPEFNNAKQVARQLQEDYYLECARKGMNGEIERFSAPMAIFLLKCRFGYTEFGPKDQEPAKLVFNFTDGKVDKDDSNSD